MRILGIDPGSLYTGYGVVDSEGQTLKHVASGCVRTSGGEFTQRLHEIFFGVDTLVDEFRPMELVVEKAFVHKNADSALKLGQARAAAICATLKYKLPVHEYTPREVKLALTGKGSAGKEQVQHMVKILLSLQGRMQADSADALAVAICHAHSRGLRLRLAAGQGVGR
ncbi:MAG: crossover junction endodeoxyribonuclease RuvC [Gammaproteobacteria bacterium]|nr:crossover junction endodeoxyribonuclease RuvC [Gammaproteobacteria bacterium]